MKRILLSLAIISIVAAGAIGATRAYFSDSQTISGNTFTAGTMALRIDSDARSGFYNWTTSFTNNTAFAGLYPEATGSQIIDIMNVGGVDGNATLALGRTSAWNNLAGVLQFHIWYQGDHASPFVDTGIVGTVDQFDHTYTLGAITGTDVTGGKTASIRIDWSVPTTAGNEIQGQSVTINGVFGVEQVH
jgi:predicted ribosomally synthesized peptide with SipW-like signal peptide